MEVVLRDYQKDACDSLLHGLEERDHALCVAPTGSGKTEIMIGLMREILLMEPDASFLVIIKRINLVDQTANKFESSGIKSSVYCASLNKKQISSVTVSSVDSIKKVMGIKFDYVILDEVHNFDSLDFDSVYSRIIRSLHESGSKFVGFTATPFRSNGYIYGEDESFFNKLDYSIKLQTLIDQKYLVPPVIKSTKNSFSTNGLSTRLGDWDQKQVDELASDEIKLSMQVKEALDRLGGRRKIFWQAANISHCERIASKIFSLSGEECVTVHSNLSMEDRESSIKRFESLSGPRHCAFVSILSEGYNYPPADALVLMRPTKSPVLYVQTVGRVLRTSPETGKKDALILDFGRVRENCGPLDSPVIRKRGRGQSFDAEAKAAFWLCNNCFTYNDLSRPACLDCGAERARKSSPETSTTDAPQEEIELLSKFKYIKKEIRSVTYVRAAKHTSKIGNPCIKFSFILQGQTMWDSQSVSKYCTINKAYGKIKADETARALGFDGLDDVMQRLESMDSVVCPRKPSRVELIDDEKFKSIGRMYFDS